MSNLPTRPEFSRSADTWRESGDERRSPERPRDDRDRNRSRYPPRSPPSRSRDTYIGGRDSYHAREYRSYDDSRRDDRRDRDRDRDMDRDRAHYRRQRVDDHWTPQRDYSPNRSRRGYHDRRTRDDDYRRERHWDRGRSWDRDSRDRDHDRRPSSPNYRLSPRRDHHRELHSPPRRGPPSYPSRGRRSASPRSVGSRRSSPVPRGRPESYTRPRRSPSPRRASPSPNRYSRRMSSPTRRRPSPETTDRQLHSDDRHIAPNGPEPVQRAEPAVEGAAILDDQMDVKGTGVLVTPDMDHSDNRDGEVHVKAESPAPASSPIECQEQLIPTVETVTMASSEETVTQPYLPTIPRYEAKPRFSVGYESEYNRLESHRAHAAAECRRCLKASRRALHELEMTTHDLRAATNRRELAEAHRKKAHHGQLGIDAESV